ncbi:cupin domain-containing protein [Chloroflexota bacterium]
MKKITLDMVKPYEAAGHFGMVPMRLSGKQETGAQKISVGLSHFLPGGGAEFSSSATEKYYFVLEGELTVKTEKEEITLGPWDSVFIGPDEGRSILNKTNKPVSMLVIGHY